MPRQTYDWRAAETAVRNAIAELYAAQRHINHRKRVNVLNELIAAEHAVARAYEALTADVGKRPK
jgi:hypothetical protein